MQHLRQSGEQIVLFILSLIGIAIAIYLTIVHYNSHVQLICSSSGIINCEHVLASPYAYIPGTSIPTSVAGIAWSMVGALLAIAAWLIWPEKRRVLIAELVWGAIGILTVFYLVYAEIVVLHAICAWCTVVHFIVLLYLLIVVFLVSRSTDELEAEVEQEPAEMSMKSNAHAYPSQRAR